MKKTILCFVLICMCALCASAQMSDASVLNYIKTEADKGTSQQQIAIELSKRGVTKAQLERIKSQQEQSDLSGVSSTKSSSQLSRERRADINETVNTGEFDEVVVDMSPAFTSNARSGVFGRDIFNKKNLTFSPNVNIPTPLDYVLGPGDEVIIDVWGASQATIRQIISSEGSITIDRIGPIYLNGMTIAEANQYVHNKIVNIYAGIEGGTGATSMKLTLGQIRSIQVNVMGEVVAPGTYTLSSLSSVFHALYNAGGVSDIGSLRTVKLYRNGSLVKTLDVYGYLLEGKLGNDTRLMDGDVIIVPTYVSLVDISGKVKRPMLYEMTAKETLADLIRYAGGYAGDAYTEKIRIVRSSGNENRIFTIGESDVKSFRLQDQDAVTVSPGLDLFDNRVEINGAVFRSGFYELGSDVSSVGELVASAGGLRGDAFLNRAILTRERDDYTLETIPVDIGSLLSGNVPDIALRKNDILYIPSVHDLAEKGDFVVHGEVARPGSYKYADNTTLEDLIIQAGGLLESASVVRVDVSRRIIDPRSTEALASLSANYSFSIKDGYVISGDRDFMLAPYDEIYVRRSPGYHPQQNVSVVGEVLFPGTYALNRKTERISDIVRRAGDITEWAYPEGARLERRRTDAERARTQMAIRTARQSAAAGDSISMSSLFLDDVYSVGIELDRALANPGSEYDLVMREGDRLMIPEFDNSVKINGAVMFPNTIAFKSSERLKYYINQAGGFSQSAKRRRVFVIHMNGTVSRVRAMNRYAIRPGSEIIVPSRDLSRRFSAAEIISMGSGITSMAALVTTLINTTK